MVACDAPEGPFEHSPVRTGFATVLFSPAANLRSFLLWYDPRFRNQLSRMGAALTYQLFRDNRGKDAVSSWCKMNPIAIEASANPRILGHV